MKKFLIFMVALTMVMITHAAFAGGVTKKVSEDPVLLDWKFAPKVETYAGYNLDTGNVGLLGSASLDLETTIHKKSNKEFGGKDGEGTYGYIKVKDLKIKIDTGRKNSKYDSTKTSDKKTDPNYNNEKTSPLLISWGTVEGAIHIGPVYINLKHTGHNDQDFIDKSGLDKGSLAFSVIEYSVIPVYTTSQYAGNTTGDSDTYKSDIVTLKNDPKDASKNGNPDGSIKETFPTGGLGAFSIGFKSADLMDVRLGISTKYTYKQHVPRNKSNPTALSLYFELLAVKNLTLKLAVTGNMGVNNNPIMYDGNPVTIGLLTGYTMGHITPYVGAEFRMEKKQKIDATSTLVGATPTVKAVSIKDNKYIYANSYQFALGLTYDWKELGEDDNEDDHLAMAPKDEDATDGVSLGILYGATPHKVFRESMVPFLGAKIALWESEGTDKPGIIPGLQAGLIVNYNIAMGTKYTSNKSITDDAGKITKDAEYTIGQRHDIGLGFEASYTLGFIKPHLGVIYKAFDVLKGKDKIVTKENGTKNADFSTDDGRRATDALDNDFRVKLGVDVIKMVKNTTFKIWWESGNLINKESRRKFAEDNTFEYADSNFYTNNQGSSNTSSVFWNSAAKLGFIALGAEIKF